MNTRYHLKQKELCIHASLCSGEVLASTILQYLQTMTVQSTDQDRLATLQHLLDPYCQDPVVSRETFHLAMREWVSQCTQDRCHYRLCIEVWLKSFI